MSEELAGEVNHRRNWAKFTGRIAACFLQAIFHHGVDDFLCNGIPQGVGNRAAADSKFGSDVLLLPALEVKLDDLHVYRLQGLQGNVVGRGH